jgi:NAD(P)-dependent dehydrogenase (short-subunit alcohol dehydrogenase family)
MADGERRTALISGANRGIGLEIAGQLARAGLRVLAGSRDPDAGERAVAPLADEGLDVRAVELDVGDPGAAARLGGEIDRVDVLVNNAGVSGVTGTGAVAADLDEIKAVLEVNLFGAWRLAEAFAPGMRDRGWGRIVQLSSGMGQLEDMGGGAPAYRLSKVGLNGLTRMLAAELRDHGVLVNSACPGWVRTDMGGPNARSSVEQGADTPVWLATLPDDGPTGGFFRRRQPIPW